MTLEYLVSNKEDAQKCINLINDEGKVSSSNSMLNENYYIVTATIDSESKEAAFVLSSLNKKICESINCTVLTNGSASYFNKVLFPLINDFERKLRKLLYSTSAIKTDVKGRDTIADLEAKDFGQLFDILFKDNDYQKRIIAFVNSKNGKGWRGYSQELLSFLKEEEEDLLWDRLLENKVPSLRKNFSDLRNKRNDVMHAHNIDKEGFLYSLRLFKAANREIDIAIESLEDGALVPDSYNQEIEAALVENTLNNIIDTNSDNVGGIKIDPQTAMLKELAAKQQLRMLENRLRRLNIDKYLEYMSKIANYHKTIEDATTELQEIEKTYNGELDDVTQNKKKELETVRGEAIRNIMNRESLLMSYLYECHIK